MCVPDREDACPGRPGRRQRSACRGPHWTRRSGHWASGKSGSSACDKFRGDQMRDEGRCAGNVEPPNPLVVRAIANRRALVLAQVLEPGLGDEAFDVTPVSSWILVDGPPDGAVTAANRLQVADGF